MASNLALIALSLTLGLLFVAIGSIKLTPAISSDMHKEMDLIDEVFFAVLWLVGVDPPQPTTTQQRTLHQVLWSLSVKSTFKRARTVFPLYNQTGWRPKTSEYRRAVGTLELVCGLMLMFVPGKLRTVANILLIALMIGAVYTHMALGDDIKHCTGALIFGLLLTCRLVIHMQSSANPSDDVRQQRAKSD